MQLVGSVYRYLKANKQLRLFVRYNPVWYRYLSRNPHRINELEDEAKYFFGKTFNQRVKKVNEHVQLIDTLLEMTSNMRD